MRALCRQHGSERKTSSANVALYAKEAPSYDEEMDFFERRITRDRASRWACSRAIGATLEVAIGTGLNLAHYPTGLNLIGLDLSPEMLAWPAPGLNRWVGRVELLEADAQDLPFPDECFRHRGVHLRVVQRPRRCPGGERDGTCPQDRWPSHPGGPCPRSTFLPFFWFQWLYEFIPRRTKGEYMTADRPNTSATDFEIVDHDRLRAGIVERMVAVKR